MHYYPQFKFIKDIIIQNPNINEISNILKSQESKHELEKLISYIVDNGGIESSAALAINLPNQITVTLQPKDKVKYLLGLHVDGWGKKYEKLQERDTFPTKLCLNLGAHERHFIFINMTLSRIYKILVENDMSDSLKLCQPWNIGNLFMKRFPNYPIIKLQILPGEAYIAPTKNMIHDGSNLGSKYHDVNLQVEGFFRRSLK